MLARYLRVPLVVIGLAGFVLANPGYAEIFRYIGPDGTLHFSNVPVDKRYRPFAPAGAAFSQLRRMPKGQRARFYKLIDETALAYRLDPALVRAVVKAESDYDPTAVSSAGALGLMQLMPKTAVDLAVKNPLDPGENVRGGVQYLRYLLDRFRGDTSLAVAAYHAGEGNVDRHGGIPPIPATQAYVKRVTTLHKLYRDRLPKTDKAIYTVKADDVVLYTNTPPVR